MSRRFQLDSAIAADIQTVNADSYIDSLKMIDIDIIKPNKNNFYENSEIEALAALPTSLFAASCILRMPL